MTDALSQHTTHGYDAARQQTLRIDARGNRTTYVLDDGGRLTGRRYPDGSRATFAYDALIRRTKMHDATGRYTSTFDDGSRLTAVVNPGSKRLTYSYDATGRRTRLIEPEGGRFTYSYDDVGRIKYLINPQSQRPTYSYDAAGQTTGTRLANGARVSYAYDDAGRLKRLANLKSDNTTLSSFDYAYDVLGNRSRVIEHGGVRVTWTYDDLSRLTRERRGGANSYDVTYTYDAAGNRKTKIDGGTRTTYTYDAANELLTEQVGAARTTYTYDANGNQATKKTSATSITTCTWDYENKLTKVVLPSGTRNTFTYSAGGQRVKKEDTGGTAKLLWDLENILLETDASDVTQVVYTLAPALYGRLVSQRRSGTTSFFHFDGLGSADRLTGTDQSITDSYVYKAFGDIVTASAPTANPFRYGGDLGYYWNADLSAYLLRARLYDPTIARFMSSDPLRVARSYTYASQNPVNAVDPSGLQPSPPGPCQYIINYMNSLSNWCRDAWYVPSHVTALACWRELPKGGAPGPCGHICVYHLAMGCLLEQHTDAVCACPSRTTAGYCWCWTLRPVAHFITDIAFNVVEDVTGTPRSTGGTQTVTLPLDPRWRPPPPSPTAPPSPPTYNPPYFEPKPGLEHLGPGPGHGNYY